MRVFYFCLKHLSFLTIIINSLNEQPFDTENEKEWVSQIRNQLSIDMDCWEYSANKKKYAIILYSALNIDEKRYVSCSISEILNGEVF